MKTRIATFILIAVLFAGQAQAQSTKDNFVTVLKGTSPTQKDLAKLKNKDSVSVTSIYFDGLGREIQSVSRQASPLGNDVVGISAYDGYGRKSTSYLPYVSAEKTGAAKVNSLADQIAFYTNLYGRNGGTTAYTTSVFEHSGIARLSIQSAPGDSWKMASGHVTKKEYATNNEREVLLLRYDSLRSSFYLDASPREPAAYYAAGQLTSTKTVDEEGNDTIEYVDKEGRTICRKVKASGSVYASTYYIYDDYGNPVIVLPPEGVVQFLADN